MTDEANIRTDLEDVKFEEEQNSDQQSSDENSESINALEANIDTKGKNAYYYAHSFKASGPKWDGKIEPQLLSKESSTKIASSSTSIKSIATKKSSFDYDKSNITSYAFSDEGDIVKIYVELEGIGEKCTNDNDILLDYTETSFQLTVQNYDEFGLERCLCFSKLFDDIESASLKKRKNRVVLSLVKKKKVQVVAESDEDKNDESVKDWPSIGAVGAPYK